MFDVGGLDTAAGAGSRRPHFPRILERRPDAELCRQLRPPRALNTDKEINTQWLNVGFSYNFNRDWGVMVRVPTTNRTLTTDQPGSPGEIQSFNSKDIGDIEIMGMYTGFFKDMSTGIIFGVKLPTGTFTAPGLDRDTQIGTGSTDLLLGAFHRGLLTGDNAWQYFAQAMWRQPFLYQAAPDPQGFFDGNAGVVQTYHPGLQVDGAAGILYNNWYHVLGFDKITPLGQVIVSHRDNDTGTAADPYNCGFDRVMLSPGIEFTKVVDEANNRVMQALFRRRGSGLLPGQRRRKCRDRRPAVAPYVLKLVASYNF